MTLASAGFLLPFLPLSVVIYWRLIQQPRHKLLYLCALSFLFYMFSGVAFLLLLVGLSLATFWLARRRRILVAIALNLAALAFFKYWNFGADNLNALAHAAGLPALLPLLSLALPLGISFYVFKHIGYLLDVRAGRCPPTSDLLLFLAYSAFFPQITAGPLSSFEDTSAQLRQLPTRLGGDLAYQGFTHITLGLAKKVLIADTLWIALETGLFQTTTAGSGALWAWVSVLMYAIRIYFDFSGYTDIALGIACWFGVRLPPNFNNPYLATSPSQFWARWHISLSTWFRFYLFSPLSRLLLRRWGSERAAAAQYSANLVTMILVGLWHGAGWGFILWGIYHGLLLNGYAWAARRKLRLEQPLLLFIAVLIGWALFLSPSRAFAADLLRSLFGLNGLGSLESVTGVYDAGALWTLLAGLFLTLTGGVEAANLPAPRHPAVAFGLGALALLSGLHLAQAATFIYAQF